MSQRISTAIVALCLSCALLAGCSKSGAGDAPTAPAAGSQVQPATAQAASLPVQPTAPAAPAPRNTPPQSAAETPRASTSLGVPPHPGGAPEPGAGSRGHLIVCIDPGHPSEVGRGTTGRTISEIQATWRVALKLKTILSDEGIDTVLTKNDPEQFVPNRRRAEIANGQTPIGPRANLMVRLHCDALSGSGFATFYPDRQGISGAMKGPSPEVIRASHGAAARFHHALAASLGGALPDRGLHSDIDTAVGSQQGALTGSIYSQVPVLLLEMCVLTTPRDEAFIATEDGQSKMARAIADGIRAAI